MKGSGGKKKRNEPVWILESDSESSRNSGFLCVAQPRLGKPLSYENMGKQFKDKPVWREMKSRESFDINEAVIVIAPLPLWGSELLPSDDGTQRVTDCHSPSPPHSTLMTAASPRPEWGFSHRGSLQEEQVQHHPPGISSAYLYI